jgi:hypothetical protein
VPRIDQPHAVLYTTSVPQSFFESLQKESLSDGFVSRLLVFNSKSDPETNEAARELPPEEIIAEAKWWNDYKPGGNLSGVNPQPRVMSWTPEARNILRDLEIIARTETKSGRETATLWTRAAEKARKLAILHAVSLDYEAVTVGIASADWGCWLSHFLTARMEWLAKDWVSENQHEATLKRILRTINEAGPDGISLTQLFRKLQFIPYRMRDDMIKDLRATGQLIEEKQATGGRQRLIFKTQSPG